MDFQTILVPIYLPSDFNLSEAVGAGAAVLQAIFSVIAIVWAAKSSRKAAEAQHKTAMATIIQQHKNDVEREFENFKRNQIAKIEAVWALL